MTSEQRGVSILGITQNVFKIRERISAAAIRSGRRPEEVTLLAVTKTVSPSKIKEAINAGIWELGENRVQEGLRKQVELMDPKLRWHLIGSLQTNKVKMAVPAFAVIHSLDRWRLAEALEKRGEELNNTIPVLVEVNVSGESTKHGILLGQVQEFIGELTKLPHLVPEGLMTMAPWTDRPEEVRPFFRELKQIFDRIGQGNDNPRWKHLSMGMSNDFEIAVEEGATIVRIGSAIFAPKSQH
jgi:pyridoxal phosphate enzyme (YggS family)